jgi:hypothetical protein
MAPDISRPSQLWKPLSSERKQQAAEAFWRDGEANLEHAEAIAGIAQRIKFRTKSVIALPIDKKVRHLIGMPVSELVAARLLIAYHLAHQRPMMGSFLDALGIAHENGVIAEGETPEPSSDKLLAAAAAIGKAYPGDDVSLYLSTLLWQDPETWGALADAPERVAQAGATEQA